MKGGGAVGAAKTDAAVPNSAPASNPVAPTADPKTAQAPDPKQSGTKSAPPVQLLGKPTTAAPTGTSAPDPSAGNAAGIIAHWEQKLGDTDHQPTEADAKAAIAAINPLMEKLAGADRSNAMYVEMNAYQLLDIDAQVCRTSKEVIANDPNTNHVKTATLAQTGRNCK
jgi:hypothetical protein